MENLGVSQSDADTSLCAIFHGFDMASRSQLRITSYDTKVVKFKRQYVPL